MRPKEVIDELVKVTGYPREQVRATLQAEAKLISSELRQGKPVRTMLGKLKVLERSRDGEVDDGSNGKIRVRLILTEQVDSAQPQVSE